jgi:hypothetical protein
MIARQLGRTGLEIAFPSHQGESGTCDFMTETCSKECPAFPTKKEVEVLSYFENNTITDICLELEKELIETKSTIISWFTECGDCPKRLTNKIACIIKQLSLKGIPQNGFTRNKEFWRSLNRLPNIYICLTEEKSSKAKMLMKEGLVAVPNYKTRRVNINEAVMCGGGGITCGEASIKEEDGDEYEEDCSLCAKRQVGCFGFTEEMKKTA